MLEQLYGQIFECYDQCCPIKTKTISPKQQSKPWIVGRILDFVRIRQSYYKLFKLGKIPESFYKRYRNFVTNEIRNSRKNYYRHKFDQFKGNCKKTWGLINSILKPSHVTKSISELNIHGERITDEACIAQEFNNYFSNIGSNIASNIPSNFE